MNRDSIHRQPLQAQLGEIAFREKLARQHVQGETHFDDEFSSSEIERILLERVEKTHARMRSLEKRNITLSPYVEIGAERCQRSLVMENDLGLNGAAVDLSFDMLKSCGHYQAVFNRKTAPMRICCDANTLPFMSDSVPFAFCYQVLHHFPNPDPVLKEVYRILVPGGYFFFDEEPFKKRLHLNLYARKAYAREYRASGIMRKAVDYFFAKEIKNEEDYGIIEKDDLSLASWKKALRLFDTKEIAITTVRKISTGLFQPRSLLAYLTACLLGGEISGLCRKKGTAGNTIRHIREALMCPCCFQERREERLVAEANRFRCPACNVRYPVVEGILFLFTHDAFKTLYPDTYKKTTATYTH